LKKVSYSLRIGIIGNQNYINEIFYESLKKMAIETKSSKESFSFLIVFRQIPIKIKLFITESLESIIENYEYIEKLDVIILTLNLYDRNSLNAINEQLIEEFYETYLFQGLSVLVGMDMEHLFNKSPSKKYKISRFKLEKITQDLNLIYCFEIFNKERDVNEIYNTLFNDFVLRFQYSNPELFDKAKEYGKKVLEGSNNKNKVNNPQGINLKLRTSRPKLVIGKGGKHIQEITDVLQDRFGLEMPQIEVEEVAEPDLDAQIMAERLAYSLDRGRHYRRAGYYILRKVMDAGARGVEIIISGKVTSQRARTQIFRAGTVSKSGQPAQEGVDKGVAQCIQKTEFSGVIVKILRNLVKVGGSDDSNADHLENTIEDYVIEEQEGVLSEADKNLLKKE
jgi:small subunit ribosomal protein S3